LNEDSETDLLLASIHKRYGYDFSHYSRASLMRRLQRAADQIKARSLTQLGLRLLEDAEAFDMFLRQMSITVTEMYRDPPFYKAVRENIAPVLKTFPFAKIWHAGCATGEEVYSNAILLHEEGYLKRSRLYATDFNKHSLHVAESGVSPARTLPAYTDNYEKAGGLARLSDYYSEAYDLLKIKDYMKENITFSYHNLVTDGVFGEMNVIFCRNVLIYFDKVLQDQVLIKFAQSLRHGGFLCLGAKESLNFSAVKDLFEPVDRKQRIYRKVGTAHV